MPSEQDLHMTLRRRFIEQAQARRPRLTKNLRQLGAVGPVTRPLPPSSQQAIVKVGVTTATTTGQHLRYLQHGKGDHGQQAALFGPGAMDRRAFVQAAQQDPHQFRLVVSVPEHARLDRTSYIELFMAQVERDLQRPLDWVAAHHYNTEHPHTHIALRGRDTHGKDLYMAKHYLTQGLRDRASQLLTWLIGPRAAERQQHQATEHPSMPAHDMQQSLVPPVSAGTPTMADIPDLPREERPPRVPVLTLRDRLDALQHRLQSRQHGRQPSQDQDQGLGL